MTGRATCGNWRTSSNGPSFSRMTMSSARRPSKRFSRYSSAVAELGALPESSRAAEPCDHVGPIASARVRIGVRCASRHRQLANAGRCRSSARAKHVARDILSTKALRPGCWGSTASHSHERSRSMRSSCRKRTRPSDHRNSSRRQAKSNKAGRVPAFSLRRTTTEQQRRSEIPASEIAQSSASSLPDESRWNSVRFEAGMRGRGPVSARRCACPQVIRHLADSESRRRTVKRNRVLARGEVRLVFGNHALSESSRDTPN